MHGRKTLGRLLGGMAALLDADKARKELETKDLLRVERDTAVTWGGRAAACYQKVVDAKDHGDQMKAYIDAENYRSEALEHAAQAEDPGLLEQVINEIDEFRVRARDVLFMAGDQEPAQPQGGRPSRLSGQSGGTHREKEWVSGRAAAAAPRPPVKP